MTDEQLEHARRELLRLPAERTPRAERKAGLDVIQAAADAFTPAEYTRYRTAWGEPGQARAMEAGGILAHLRRSIDHAAAEFRKTRVKRGMACWLVYNMGYLVRTPTAGFGIDLSICGAEELAGDLDFLLTTHGHLDHYSPRLLDAMIAAGKPCVTRGWPRSLLVTEAAALRFGAVHVDVTIGDHHYSRPDCCNDMLMFHIYEKGGASLLHAGDNSNVQKLGRALRPELFTFHCAVGMSVAEAIRHVEPAIALPAHVMELEHSPHPPHAWRWPFEYGHQTVAEFPEAKAPLLSWGERILAPGTEL
jgi:hypothetical protein